MCRRCGGGALFVRCRQNLVSLEFDTISFAVGTARGRFDPQKHLVGRRYSGPTPISQAGTATLITHHTLYHRAMLPNLRDGASIDATAPRHENSTSPEHVVAWSRGLPGCPCSSGTLPQQLTRSTNDKAQAHRAAMTVSGWRLLLLLIPSHD